MGREKDFDPVKPLAPSQAPARAAPNRGDGGAADRGDPDPPTPFDRLLRAGLARYSLGLSPAALWLAYADWAIHLAASPGKRAELTEKGFRKLVRFIAYALSSAGRPDAEGCIEPLPQDRRFDSDLWRQPPFNLFHQWFLLQQQWWHSATTGVSGVSAHHEQLTTFMARQALDTVSPVNFILTNPEVLAATVAEGGLNLARGALNFWQDWERALGEKPPLGAERFRPGREVAVTPGAVVFRNRLIELIQYAPATPEAAAEPVLIVPAWIMKYYILDLSPQNSLVKYLVDHGHTVFIISWRNPGAEDRDIGMDDYLRLGLLEALKAVNAIVPNTPVNAVGYCLGGTLLSIAAAYLAREGKSAFNTITLLAAQTDFTEAGELSLFIDESQLSFLDDIMWNQGFLDARQMAGTFQLLRSGDLIWSRMVHEYLMGQRPPMNDLMAWNADATRMPYRMHSEYLRKLFLDNDLFEGRYSVDGRPVSLGDIQAPLFVVATESDHVAPWRSVYKIHLVESIDITFVLTSGGHNAGIVSEPGHPGRRLRVGRRAAHTRFSGPDEWLARAEHAQGSWWPKWLDWLDGRSREKIAAPGVGRPDCGYAPITPAPGTYVLQS